MSGLTIHIEGMQLQGRNNEQQDFFYIREEKTNEPSSKNGYIAGIFDGYGDCGVDVAKAVENLFKEEFAKTSLEISYTEEQIKNTLTDVFETVNQKLKKTYSRVARISGTTAIVAYLLGHKLVIAHAGDSRAIWGGDVAKQTVDHSTYNPEERGRFKQGQIITDEAGCMRVGDDVICTRGFGSFYLKEKTNNIFSQAPEINVIDLTKDSVVIMGSDGVYDDLSRQFSTEDTSLKDNTWVYTMITETLTKNSLALA